MSEREGTVQIAYLHRDNVSHSWRKSMREMERYDRTHGRYLREKELDVWTHPIRIVQSRNMVAQAFLDHTDAEWLFWVDTDMAWHPDSLERLLEVADPVTAPVVGGLCFGMYKTGHDGLHGHRFSIKPTMFRLASRVKDGAWVFSPMPRYPIDTVVEVDATGSAFLLIHRTVLEKVRAEHGDHWYDQMVGGDGEVLGEDIAFCMRARALGTPMFVDTRVATTHHKEVWIGEEDFWAQHADEQMANPAPNLPIVTHLPATFDALARNQHEHEGMLKFVSDLARYADIIRATKPEVIVETGTRTGASARWFADRGVDVITVDLVVPDVWVADDPGDEMGTGQFVPVAHERARFLSGDSTDPATVERVRNLVAGRRCMVSLDSEHSAAHVRREIEAYGPMVSPGCYLVVEDTIFGYGQDAKAQHGMGELEGSPLDAVVSHLADNPAWSRDMAIEQTHPIGSNPAGWWVRNG